jgi:hypothetical protein
MDDLESFYYVLCYIVACHSASGPSKPRPAPYPISTWFSEKGGHAEKDSALYQRTYRYDIHPSFEPPVTKLMESLHHFFRNQVVIHWDVERVSNLEEDYREFLTHIDHAIKALTEINPTSASPASQSNVERFAEPLQERPLVTTEPTPEAHGLLGGMPRDGPHDEYPDVKYPISASETGTRPNWGAPYSLEDASLGPMLSSSATDEYQQPHTLTVGSPLHSPDGEYVTRDITIDNYKVCSDSKQHNEKRKDQASSASSSPPPKRPRMDKDSRTQEENSTMYNPGRLG